METIGIATQIEHYYKYAKYEYSRVISSIFPVSHSLVGKRQQVELPDVWGLGRRTHISCARSQPTKHT